jgi:hypothetical protein
MTNKLGMGGHQCNEMLSDEWLTPPKIIKSLGPFYMDPCSPINRPWDTAQIHYTKNDDGLSKKWNGRVWLNPPYGKHTGIWLNRLAKHGKGIALIFARTETKMFFNEVWGKASSILFLKDRLFFYRIDGTRAKHNSGAPSCLVAYGQDESDILYRSKLHGSFISRWMCR